MLGCCMILMAAFIWLKPKFVGAIGIAIILGQQLFTLVPEMVPESLSGPFLEFWKFIYPTGFENPETDTVAVLYVIVPWIGVMAAGYTFGLLLQMEKERRKRVCIALGSSITALFLIIAAVQYFQSESTRPFIFEILGQQKYPASPLFLMMTLGPLILFVPFVETAKSKLAVALKTIGRVPLFYYLLHILLIHISALVVQLISDGAVHHEWFDYAPFTFVPKEFVWGLPTLYIVFIIDVIILYVMCKWYAGYKIAHPEKRWTKYL